jgi:predicted adenylyl cyclase CyaB
VSENIEIKAICIDLNAAEERIKEITRLSPKDDYQVDTYFNITHGRLKLRESTIDGNYLIPYVRADEAGPRKSYYEKIIVDNPGIVKQLFSMLMGIHIVVSKKRRIFIDDNVRIHLDQVENLGTFIEIEAVMDSTNNDKKVEIQKVHRLMDLIGISEADLIPFSYESLLSLQNP